MMSKTRKQSKKNAHVSKKNRKNLSSRVVCHYYCEKGHIRPKLHIQNVKIPNSLMAWRPKSPSANAQGPNTSWGPKIPY